jgi:presequence protease
VPLTEVFARALLEMGTETEDYVKLSQRIGKSTGGIHGSATTATVLGSRESVAKLFLRGKATAAQSAELLNILKDILLTTKFDNKETVQADRPRGKSGARIHARPARTCLCQPASARPVQRIGMGYRTR